ncbi:MAG: uncharacterized protein KVP18_004115 [Porospora cf. gigantea A]|nr:MAG: hypothetical protein KVP18_004115 [Porospora cf. gigantea A]
MLEPSEHKFYALKLASIEDEDVPIEADLLLKHRHTCVVPLIAVFVGQQVEVQRNRQKSKQKFMCLLMTLATGNLETQLLKASGSTSERLTPQQARIILLDTARGMAYLHTPSQSQEHLLHRDLKPANILLDNTSGPLWRAQIADFGVSTLRKENGMTDMTMGPGTDGYIAPEQQTTVYSRPADVWSFGVVVSRLIGWEHWKDLTGLGLQRFVRSCHEDAYLKDLAVRCLSPDPLLRPSFKDIQGMLWLDLLRSEFEAAVTRLCSRKGHTLRAVSHGLSPGKENTSDSFFFQ